MKKERTYHLRTEKWKPVKGYEGYEGLYEVSTFGNVNSIKRPGSKGGLLKYSIDRYGYKKVVLSKDGSHKNVFVHRLVGYTWLKIKQGKTIINHKNLNTGDNHFWNLEWCDRQYNNTYADRIDKASKKCFKPIMQQNLDGSLVRIWESGVSINKELGYSRSYISQCCNGIKDTAYGFRWKFT